MLKLTAALLLAGCSTCQTYGVDVPDDAPITGKILEEHKGSVAEVMAHCQSPFHVRYGCAIATAPGEYVIWYTDDYVRGHERCHALHEAGH